MRPQTRLLAWYREHRRDLPWRQTRDPYRILVSEVMLQQTQVDRVIPFYQRWLETFPSAKVLAQASLEQVHRLWKGLGYPSRAERLQAACQMVVGERGGTWPDDEVGLRELPGIGPYTAAAVACFAFGLPSAVVDTNVARVYARRDGLPLPLDREALTRHAASEVDGRDPIAYNNALMELGALVCTARSPDCPACPWAGICQARDDAARIAATSAPLSPVKTPSAGPKTRGKAFRTVVLALIHDGQGHYLAAERRADDSFAGFWELPGGKREPGENDRQALAREIREELGAEILSARPFLTWDHAYGRKLWQFRCYRCRLFAPRSARPISAARLTWLEPAGFLKLRFPPGNAALLERFAAYHRMS